MEDTNLLRDKWLPSALGILGIALFVMAIVSAVFWNDSYIRNSGIAQTGIFFGIFLGLILMFWGYLARWDFRRKYCLRCNCRGEDSKRVFTGFTRAPAYHRTLRCPKCKKEWMVREINPD